MCPYVVVNTITSRLRPRTVTPANSIADESAVPGSLTVRSRKRLTLRAVMPVSAGPTPLRAAS